MPMESSELTISELMKLKLGERFITELSLRDSIKQRAYMYPTLIRIQTLPLRYKPKPLS